jgi:flagellar biosynthesis/type III secretory pathway protein FliH
MAEIEFTAKCSECGRVLDVTTDIRAGNLFIDVTACEHCIDSAKNEADKDGFSRGFDDGSDQGHKEGFEEGKDAGYQKGYEDGKREATHE